jgi:enamine deaminase RidA (YjgF/YER057c/UK114 family)
MKIESRLAELHLTLPASPRPAGNYVPFVVAERLVFIAGQVPRVNGEVAFTGKVPSVADEQRATQAARVCALNILAQLKVACGGNLDRVKRCVRLAGFVNSDPSFTRQPAVLNGASDLMVQVFGEQGAHARTAVGVAALPSDATVEIEAIFELHPT